MKQYRTYIERPCEVCGKLFTTRKDSNTKICSKECLSELWKRKPRIIKICPNCGKDFEAKRQSKKFCSPECISEYRKKGKYQVLVCEYCKEEFTRLKSNIKGIHNFCSKECYDSFAIENNMRAGENHPNWGSGNAIQNGYEFKRVGKEKYRAKHRLIMEKAIGRELRSDEIVHHKDGNKLNNALENLEIVTRAEHINIHRDSLYGNRKAGIVQAEVWIGGGPYCLQ